ncbi:MAG: hypothetical protein MK080_11210 [Opitutales bacterium]|nr:hypothetical protein [Opitutales bacterium]NRA26403.1 hypothetical protein [Opitutales bacterium]
MMIEEPPERSKTGPAWPGLGDDSGSEQKIAGGSMLVISILLHLWLVALFWDDFLGLGNFEEVIEEAAEESYVLELQPVEEEPPEYIQTNPDVPDNEPDESPFVSNRDQQAARENPVPGSDDPIPTIESDEEGNNIVESSLEEPSPPSPAVPAMQGQPGAEQARPGEGEVTQADRQVGTPTRRGIPDGADAADPVRSESPQQETAQTQQPEQQPIPSFIQPSSEPSPPPAFLQREEAESLEGEGAGLTLVEPGVSETPFQAMAPSRIIPTVRRSQPNFRIVQETPVIPPRGEPEGLAETPSDQPGETEQAATPEFQPSTEAQVPRPRIRILPQTTPGPLMDNPGTFAGREGTVAVDAEFSAFGEYTAQFLNYISTSWHRTLRGMQMRVGDSGTRVMIQFELNSDGSIADMKTLEYTSSRLMMNVCRDAIQSRAPYDPWPQDMIELFGDSRTMTITFHYR